MGTFPIGDYYCNIRSKPLQHKEIVSATLQTHCKLHVLVVADVVLGCFSQYKRIRLIELFILHHTCKLFSLCSTYNADFDGDEMNVHFPQDEISRAEAINIVDANKQYIGPRSGDAVRGLMQVKHA
jgi:DNA-directed RNA polymerase beta' subunit